MDTTPTGAPTGKEKSLANLKPPWPKGKSGNPNGTGYKNWSPETWGKHILKSKTRTILEHQAPGLADGPFADLPMMQTFLERLLIQAAFKNNTGAARLCLEYAFGAPEQRVVVRHDDPERDAWREKILALMKDPKTREHLLALAEASVKETPPEKP